MLLPPSGSIAARRHQAAVEDLGLGVADEYRRKHVRSVFLQFLQGHQRMGLPRTSNLPHNPRRGLRLAEPPDNLTGPAEIICAFLARRVVQAQDKIRLRRASQPLLNQWPRGQEVAQADDGKYGDAVATLKEIFTKIETKTPDYSDLKDALADLFADGVIPRVTNIDETTTPADIAVFPDSGENYEKKDFDDDDDSLELWYEFAGNKDSAEDDEYYVGAYREALRVYSLCAKSSTRKFVAQSTVDNALEDLNTAIMNLDPDAETDNWLFVRLEDALDKANEVIEDDYRTTATAWKNFEKAKENVEKALENSNLTESAAERYAVALETAIKNLSSARKSVPTATKNELKDALKEAKDMQKDKDGKTASQINNLDEAIKAADKLNANTSLISEYETAIADLETAMTAYNQQQGWYKDGNTWYYGKEDTVAKGWLNVNGVWYLLDDTTGAMKTGWQQVNGTWYYMNASGAMQTGWLNLNGTYYYLESWGGMATGWKNVNGSWYYLQSSGAMVANGWYWINGKCYYFYNWGGMAANTTINGWTVGADGAWIQ